MQVSLKFAPKSIRCMWKNSEMLKRRAVAMMDVLDLHDWYVAHDFFIVCFADVTFNQESDDMACR